MHNVYIIYSKVLNKYYIGETENVVERLFQHNSKFFSNSFTGITSDWELFFVIRVPNRTIARKIEFHIKKMKSRKYIENLKNHPSISERLLRIYS